MLIWLLGIGLAALRLLLGRMRFAWLIRTASTVDASWWLLHVHEIAGRLGIRRRVGLLESEETEIPLTSGAWRPKIVLSPDYADWSPLRRDAILHHELAHIKRLDAVAQAIGHTATALYWFHPLVWLTVKAMRAEREQACDDYVLAAGTKPSEYAHELLEIASSLRQPAFISALAMARRSELEGRVMALLNPAQRRGSISQFTTLILVLLTMCVVLPLAAIQTAAPQQKKSKPHPEVKPAPSARSATGTTEEQPPEPPQPPAPSAPPTPPPVDGIPGGVEGGVTGGVPGGASGGVQDAPALAAPPALPAPPQAVSPAPALPKAPAIPPQAAPHPKAVPIPHVAPVAPAKPTAPESPTSDSDAPKAAALAAVRAKVVAIRAQEDVKLAEIKALRATIEAKASTTALVKVTEIARIRAEKGAIAAIAASKAGQVAALRANLAALEVSKAQAASTGPEVAAQSDQIAASPEGASGSGGDTTCLAGAGHAGEVTIDKQDNHQHWTVNWPKQKCRVDLRSEGKVAFNESGAVESISPGGYLDFSEVNGDTRRQVRVTPSPDGLKFVFKMNGAEQPFGDDAKAWFSGALNRLRWTTFANVRIRVKSLSRTAGPGDTPRPD
jgi:hypothetical protein